MQVGPVQSKLEDILELSSHKSDSSPINGMGQMGHTLEQPFLLRK